MKRCSMLVFTCQWEPLELVSSVRPRTPWRGFPLHPPAGACLDSESGFQGWAVGNMDSAHPATKRISRDAASREGILVLSIFEREYQDKAAEREFNFGQSLGHIWVPACVPGRPLWQFLCLRQSPIPVISAACQGNEAGAFCGCLHESLNARYALLEWYRLVWCAVPCYRLVWCAVLCCLAGVRRVSKESKRPNCMHPITWWSRCRSNTLQLHGVKHSKLQPKSWISADICWF